jgi:hypothetical protein
MGITGIEDQGDHVVDASYRGESARVKVRVATAVLGGVDVAWIQPTDGVGAYAEHLQKHGPGIMALLHRASAAEIEAETARLGRAGVSILQRSQGPDILRGVLFDTRAEGKYVLGLTDRRPSGEKEGLPFDLELSQFAFTVEDMAPVSAYWKKLGFPEIAVAYGPLHDRQHHGRPADFELELGWQRHGAVPYEWIRVKKGPFDARPEGPHHLGLDTARIDEVIAAAAAGGVGLAQSGGWGTKGQPGSGRFAFLDTDPFSGAFLELLWRRPN